MSDKRLKVVVPLVIALVVAWFLLRGGGDDEAERARIRDRFLEAVAAWENQDLSGLMSFISKDYRDRQVAELNHGFVFIYHRERLFKDRNTLEANVDLDSIEVNLIDPEHARIAFDARPTVDSGSGPRPLLSGPDGGPAHLLVEVQKEGSVGADWKLISSSGPGSQYQDSAL